MIDFTFDSHVHFFANGLEAVDWRISSTNLSLPSHLTSQPLVRAYGLPHSSPDSHLKNLCELHPDLSFFLSFADGHSSFINYNFISRFLPELNSKEKEELLLRADKILDCGFILKEKDRDLISSFLPARSQAELLKMGNLSLKKFQEQSISKVRHLTANSLHWEALKKLPVQNFEIQCFFSEFLGQSFEEAANIYTGAKKESLTNPQKNIQAKGLKFFVDGSFSRNTAFVSSKKESLARISPSELSEKLETTLVDLQGECALHCIGDLALEQALTCLESVYKKHSKSKLPTCHFEHAPIFNETSLKTIQRLVSEHQAPLQFHFQPIHWNDDQVWYEKNKSALAPHLIYPFKWLNKNKIPYFFGSDTPVYSFDREQSLKAMELIAQTETGFRLDP